MALDLSRRSFFVGAVTSLIAAPAIVRAASLMPIKAFDNIFKVDTSYFESYIGPELRGFVFHDRISWINGDEQQVIEYARINKRDLFAEMERHNLAHSDNL